MRLADIELIPRSALFGNAERSHVQVSPDGRYLSWIAPVDGVPNLWVAPLHDPGQAKSITQDRGRGISRYRWTSLPDTLLYVQDTGGDENFHVFSVNLTTSASRDLTPFDKTLAGISQISARHPGSVLLSMNDRDPKWHDAYRVDLVTGERTLIYRNDDELSSIHVDDDFTPRIATRSRSDGSSDILTRTGSGGWAFSEHIPFEDTNTTGIISLTHDGRTAYLRDSRNRDTGALFSMDLQTGARTLLHESELADLGGILVNPLNGQIQAASVEHLREQWSALDESVRPDLKRLKAIGPGDFTVASRSTDDRTWIVAYAAADAPTQYYHYDRSGADGALKALFSSRPALDRKPLVQQWPQQIDTRDGLSMVSYLTLPKHADPNGDGKPDQAVPMVLLVHGGPWHRDSYGFDAHTQWLANRGYAVLQVNFRSSTGFGKAFLNKGNGEWGGRMQDDLVDAVIWAVENKVTTASQVAIMGGSYGGYATLAGLTLQPETFQCGVDIVGPSNLVTMLESFPSYWTAFMEQAYRRIGDPRTEQGRQLLLERSPLTHVDNIRKPLLIGQGANDPRVVEAESSQIVEAMKTRAIPVTYALFPDEGHGFRREENSKAFNAVAEGFLAKCLGGRAEPIGDAFKGSSITIPTGSDGVPGLTDALKAHTPVSRN
ncbi:S9 family peptidase [Bacillus subtilis subsp. subtilis]|nr:S9 family peptidase [Bacillus subtilis subsp. subtilis]